MKAVPMGWLLPVVLIGLSLNACSSSGPGEGQATATLPASVPTATVAEAGAPTVIATTAVPEPVPEEGDQVMAFQLTSAAFEQEESIPTRFTCDGEDLSPPLTWRGVPDGTQSLALIMDDPDAPVGTWVHWVLYNLQAETQALSQGIPPEAQLPDGSRHGENSWSRLGYGGPCPPSGTHRYFFKLYALDVVLDLQAGVAKDALLQAIQGHILAETELMGTYSR